MAAPHAKPKNSKNSTQAYLDIAAIKDGVVILKSGGLRAVLMTNSVNFALKSPQEQEDIVLRYQGFLNSLNFPIQIILQSRKLDLADYLVKLRQQSESQTNDQIKGQINSYVGFMEKLVSVANIMDKKFYIVIPFDPAQLKQRSFFDQLLNPVKRVTLTLTEEEFEQYKTQLNERIELIRNGLGAMGIRSSALNTQQLIELYYATYNPEEAASERLTDVDQLAAGYVLAEKQQSVGEEGEASGEV